MQTADERNIFLSTLPATSRDRTAAFAVVGVSLVLFAAPCRLLAFRSPRCRRSLRVSIRARDQRSYHGHPAVFAVRRAALAGVAAARKRISVHRGGRDRSCPHLPRTVCADRASRRGPADHRLALHDLARRISAARAGYALLKARDGGTRSVARPRRVLGSVIAVGAVMAAVTWIVTARTICCRSCSAADTTRRP